MKVVLLCGGHSTRFGSDKSLIKINGEINYKRWISIFDDLNIESIISCRSDQKNNYNHSNILIDNNADIGPMAGIIMATEQYNNEPLIIVSIDLFMRDNALLKLLTTMHDSSYDASCFMQADNHIYPLCTIIEPIIYNSIKVESKNENPSFKRVLEKSKLQKLKIPTGHSLVNINTQADLIQCYHL